MNRRRMIWGAQLAIVTLCAVSLKQYYSTATANELRWILAPTTFIVELLSGRSFQFESYMGYMSSDHTFVIAVPCAGVNFLIMAFVMLALRRLWQGRFEGVSWRFLPISMAIAYVTTVITNAIRICVALEIQRRSFEVSGLSANQLHRVEGIVIYFGFLMLLFLVMERRLMWFPVIIYYVMTLGVPLVNGAFHRAGFWEHFGFVMVMPLIIILPILLVRLFLTMPQTLLGHEKAQNRFLLILSLCGICFLLYPSSLQAQTKPDKDYLVYVLSEGADKISLVRFGPAGASIERQIDTGDMPVDIDGPHGIVISPDQQFYYVTIAHGRPFGSVWKYSTKENVRVGRAALGLFPATLDVSPDGNFLFVVNFNLHGDMVPSSVSVVSTQTMTEVARIQTCTMPHGSRLNPQGTKQYSACMMDDTLVEIDTRTLKVARHFIVTKGQEKGLTGPPQPRASSSMHSMHGNMGHGSEPPKPGDNSCLPTWAEPSSDGSSIYVACNGSSEIVEVNTNSWELVRRIPARAGVYNLEVTHDGARLLATNKRDQSVSIYDLKSGKELVRLPTKRKVLHGVVVSPDDRYAFVTVEGVGSEPGTLEIIDLVALKTVATLDLPQEAAGIDFYR